MRDQITQKYVMKCISRTLEMKKMCSLTVNSILRQQLPINFKEFNWDSFIGEIRVHASVLYSFMNACTETKNPRSNRQLLLECALLCS